MCTSFYIGEGEGIGEGNWICPGYAPNVQFEVIFQDKEPSMKGIQERRVKSPAVLLAVE